MPVLAEGKDQSKPVNTKKQTDTARPVYEVDGRFGFCLTDHAYPDGRKITFAFSPQKQMNVGVTIPDGKFKIGSRYDLSLVLGNEPARKVRAEAIDEETLLLQMGSNPSFRKKLAASKVLQVGSPSNMITFDLPAMQTRLDDLQKCIKTKANTKNDRAAKANAAMPETLKGLLVTAGFNEITPLSMNDIPPDQRPADFLWRTGNVMGGVRERIIPQDKSLSDMIGLHMKGLKTHCPGKFMAQIGREKKIAELELRTAEASCTPDQGKDIPLSVALVFYTTKNNVFTVFTFEGPAEQGAEAKTARDRLADTLLSLAKD
jgi:hypothetical protein